MAGPRIARTRFNPPASTSRTTKKWGTVVQLCVVRSAISRPMELGLSISLFSDAAAGGEELFVPAAAKTSEARISPPGPDPCKGVMSTPCSLARRRAFGEICPPAVIATGVTEAGTFIGGAALLTGDGDDAAPEGGTSP